MKNSRRAEFLSALIVLSFVSSTTAATASQMKQDRTLAHMGVITASPQHTATVKQETIGERKYQVARVVIDAKPDHIWTALTSYNRATEIYSNLKHLKVVNDNGDKKRIAFTTASLGGMWKYDYVLDIKENKADKRIEWTRHSGAFKVNEGFWQLSHVDGDKTLVTYAKYIDGGILIPQAFVTGELRKIMPEVLNNLRSAVLKDHIALSK